MTEVLWTVGLSQVSKIIAVSNFRVAILSLDPHDLTVDIHSFAPEHSRTQTFDPNWPKYVELETAGANLSRAMLTRGIPLNPRAQRRCSDDFRLRSFAMLLWKHFKYVGFIALDKSH